MRETVEVMIKFVFSMRNFMTLCKVSDISVRKNHSLIKTIKSNFKKRNNSRKHHHHQQKQQQNRQNVS